METTYDPVELAAHLEGLASRLRTEAELLRSIRPRAEPRQQAPSIDASLLGIQDLGKFLGLSRSAVYEMRQRGDGPTELRIGNRVRYRPDDVERWLDEVGRRG